MLLIIQAKKLVSVLAIFSSIIGASIGVEDQQLKSILSIQYPVTFKKDPTTVQTSLDSGGKINAMTSAYAAILGLRVCCSDVGAQNMNRLTLSTHDMVLANFEVEDKQERMHFFKKPSW